MANMINIQSDDFVILANKLEKISRSDLPVAVRGTLNNLAFKMKGTKGKRGEIDKRAEKDFDYRRNKTLFRSMTGVSKASGLNISNMKSESGIVNKPGRTQLAQGLAQQQEGGSINQKTTPYATSRSSNSLAKKIRKRDYTRGLNPIDLRNKRKNEYYKGAIRAYNQKRTVLIKGKGGADYIARIKTFNRRGNKIVYRMNVLYRLNPTGKVNLKKKRPFVNNAAIATVKFGEKEFKSQAQKRITKALKK